MAIFDRTDLIILVSAYIFLNLSVFIYLSNERIYFAPMICNYMLGFSYYVFERPGANLGKQSTKLLNSVCMCGCILSVWMFDGLADSGRILSHPIFNHVTIILFQIAISIWFNAKKEYYILPLIQVTMFVFFPVNRPTISMPRSNVFLFTFLFTTLWWIELVVGNMIMKDKNVDRLYQVVICIPVLTGDKIIATLYTVSMMALRFQALYSSTFKVNGKRVTFDEAAQINQVEEGLNKKTLEYDDFYDHGGDDVVEDEEVTKYLDGDEPEVKGNEASGKESAPYLVTPEDVSVPASVNRESSERTESNKKQNPDSSGQVDDKSGSQSVHQSQALPPRQDVPRKPRRSTTKDQKTPHVPQQEESKEEKPNNSEKNTLEKLSDYTKFSEELSSVLKANATSNREVPVAQDKSRDVLSVLPPSLTVVPGKQQIIKMKSVNFVDPPLSNLDKISSQGNRMLSFKDFVKKNSN